jgi:aminoglycoside 3-N-acetyltransferase
LVPISRQVNMNEQSGTEVVSHQHLVSGLRALGLQAGDGVVVHSSLKSFGKVEGGPAAVIAALMEVLTPQGTLLMPSFNHGAAFEDGAPGFYDPRETPTTNGAIPDCFWRMPGVMRSLDPTHPVAAWGRNARRYTEFHHRTLTMGPQSPIGLLHADGGYGLLLGVDYHSNTFHHVVEMSTSAPCLGYRSEAYPLITPDGRRVMGRTWGWRETGCPITDRAVYAAHMEANGLQRVAQIGGCQATCYRLRDCYTVIAEMLNTGYQDAPPCSRCPIRPRKVAQTVPPDWDPLTQRPQPDSVAWQY